MKINQLGLGGGGFAGGGGYSFGPISEKSAIELIHFALEQGIILFDTAPIYGFGRSEERLGRALRDFSKREKAFICTKGGVTWTEDTQRIHINNRPEVIEEMLHQSLKRLQSERIDVYFIHHFDSAVDIRYPLEVLMKAQEANKIQHIGLSNTTSEDLTKARSMGCEIAFLQEECNFFTNNFQAKKLKILDAQCIGYSPFDKGILTGRVHKANQHFSPLDVRSFAPWWKKRQAEEERAKKILALQNIPQDELLPRALSAALPEGVNATLLGCKNIADLQKILALPILQKN